MEKRFEDLIVAIRKAWDAQTSNSSSTWTPDNPSRGQCVPTALIIQDHLGGELVRYRATGHGYNEMHYCNRLPDGKIVDLTRDQYPDGMSFSELAVDLKGHTSVREKRLSDEDTSRRYRILKYRVELTATNAREA